MRLCLLVVFAFLMFAFPAVAGEAAGGNATDNTAYYERLVEIFFNTVLKIGSLLGYLGLGLTSWLAMRSIWNPNLFQQFRLKPITFGRYLGALVVVSMLIFPLQSMHLFNDFTGLVNESKGLQMCLAMDVNVGSFAWENQADACISDAEAKIKELVSYSSDAAIEEANIGLFFGAIQTLGLVFFIVMCWTLIKHAAGFENVKLTVGQCLIAMTFSSALMASPNITDFLMDLKRNESVITS